MRLYLLQHILYIFCKQVSQPLFREKQRYHESIYYERK